MKTNGDEKETHLAETTATYALGVFCQLVNPYISGVDHHKKGFMKDFFDAVLEDDGLRNPLPQHHRNRKPGKTTITTGVWSGINDTDLTRFYNGPDVYLEVQHPCWSCNSNSSSANASAGVR